MMAPAQASHGLTRDPGFFVGSHNVGFHVVSISADAGRAAGRQPDLLLVSLPVQHETAPIHPVADAGTDFRGIFADASVLRRQLVELFDLGYDGAVDANGLREPLSSMHDTVTHRVYTRSPQAFWTH